MKKIIATVLLCVPFILLTACKTITEENMEYTSSNAGFIIDEIKERWRNAVCLYTVNVDSLWEAEGKDKGISLEEFRKKATETNTAWRWDGAGFLGKVTEKTKVGTFLNYKNAISIHPNPTSSSVTVTLVKKLETWIRLNEIFKLEKDLFPFEVSFRLILDENIVWTYHNQNSYGTEIIPENVLQKAGNYRLVVNVDDAEAVANFMVIK